MTTTTTTIHLHNLIELIAGYFRYVRAVPTATRIRHLTFLSPLALVHLTIL